MKKHNQKFFSFLLIVAMMLSLVTSVAFADGASAESVQTKETDTVVQPTPADLPVPAESSPTVAAPLVENSDAVPTPAANPAEEPSTPPTTTPAVEEQGGAPTGDTPADSATTGDTPTGDTPATAAPVEDPQPSVEPTPVAEDVPSPAAQAFIAAVAVISVPETLTEDTYAALSAQVEAAYAALEALSADDLACADVLAAIAALASVAEVLDGGIDVLTPLYQTLYVDCVVNGEVVKTITLTSGDKYIQVGLQVPYLSDLLKDTKWKDVDYGRVTAVKCSPPAYFPSGLDLHEGQNIDLSNNHQRYQLIYSTSGWVDGSSSTNPDTPSGKYVLIYNKNCNDTVTNMPANYSDSPSYTTNPYNYWISTNTPARAGYTFTGWNTAANGTGTTIQPGGRVGLIPNTPTTLYAQWEKNTPPAETATATLKYDANGGTGAPADQTTTVAKGTYADFKVSSTIPTKDDSTFKGWCDDKDGNGITYTSGQYIGVLAGSTTTLYAQWEDNSTGGGDEGGDTPSSLKSTLNYDANGGTGAPTGETKDADKEKGADFIVSSTVPTWEDHTFTGWNTVANGTGTSYAAGDPINVKAGETTNLYAQWKLNPTGGDTLTLIYDDGVDDSSVSNLPAAQTETKDADGKVTFTVSTQIPSRSGFTFKGWKWGDGTIASGSSFTTYTDVTLTATWEKTSSGGEVVPTPDWGKLTVAKSVYPYRPVVAGETLVYTITATNNTGCALDSVSVYEALDSHLTFVNASCTVNTAYNASTGIWTIGSMANGASVTLVVYAKVNYGTPVNTVIYNTATISTAVSGDQGIPDGSRNGASANLVVYNGNCCYYNSAYPKTGDDAQTGLWLALMVLSLVCAGVAVVSAKKKIQNR